MNRFKCVVLARRYHLLIPVIVLGAVAGYFFGWWTLETGGTSNWRGRVLMLGEIIGVSTASASIVLMRPTLGQWELRHSRARKLALIDSLLVLASAAVPMLAASFSIRARYGPEAAWQVGLSNAVFFAAVVVIMTVGLGAIRGVMGSTVLYVSVVAVQSWQYPHLQWLPLAQVEGPGPWFDYRFVTIALIVTIGAISLAWKTAGRLYIGSDRI